MSSTIDGKGFTCPGCGGHDIHEVSKGWCRVTSHVKSLDSDHDEECDLLECEFDGNEETRHACADCGRELDDREDDGEEEMCGIQTTDGQ